MEKDVTDVARPNILAIEDDPGTAELIRMMLEVRGYDVALANSGARAIEMLQEMAEQASRWRRFPVDLVLLDAMMPGVDGFKVCQTIKDHVLLRHVPVIMVTALDATSDKVAAIEFGADDYITKPFLPEELDAAIKAKLQVKEREAVLLRRNAELETIDAVSAAAGSTLDTRRVAEEGFAALMTNTEVSGAIYVLDEAQARLQRIAQHGVMRPESLPVDEGLSGNLFRLQGALCKAALEETDPDLPVNALFAAELRAFIGVPLRAGERVLGTWWCTK